MITKADAATAPTEAPAAPAGWLAGTWTIDPAHTMVSFAVRHLMSWVRGTFSEVTGEIVTTPELAGSTATAVIGVSSVSTGTQLRDDHLRSASASAWPPTAPRSSSATRSALCWTSRRSPGPDLARSRRR